MRRPLFWFSVLVPVLLFATYLALTAGTVFLLPEELDEIEVGMAREEVFAHLRAEPMPDASVPPPSPYRKLDLPGRWVIPIYDMRSTGTEDRLFQIFGWTGLRTWMFRIDLEDVDPEERVESVQRSFEDPHTRWWRRWKGAWRSW